ncbi:MAG: glycosyltransferase [Candidatus Promineofilum sp.]|nr:glycosyltransferase [Promineifilum sp.]
MFRHDLIYDLIAFQLVLLVITLSNVRVLRRARRHSPPPRFPKVSVLIPARNEARNIERCVNSLLAQDYPDLEVLVLDDESTDGTGAMVAAIAAGEPRLKLLAGRPLKSGWTGKNWACAQLAAKAGGDLLFFTDADTYHHPRTLRELVTALEGEKADLLGGFPRQEVGTWGEKFIVPFFSWVIYCFTPLTLGYRLKTPAVSTAVGQALLFRRTAYDAIGGHRAVRAAIIEDLALARQVKGHGYRWRMVAITDLIACRMYRSGEEAAAALSRNLFAAFEFRVAPYVLAWTWLLVLFLKPFLDLALYGAGLPIDVPVAAVLVCIGLSLLVWLAPYFQLKAPLVPALLYPITMLVMGSVAWRSLWLGLRGRLMWKDRAIGRPRLRLF